MKEFNASDKIITLVGWLLLVAVLAVPSFLFYNWLSKSKLRNQAELAHAPVTGSVFPSEKDSRTSAARQPSAETVQSAAKVREAKPAETPVTAAAPAAPAVPPPGRPAAQPAPVQEEQPPSASAKPPAAAPSSAQAPASSTAAAQAQNGASQDQVATSTGPKLVSYYKPKSTRDPTFSPDDYRRIRDDQRRQAEAEKMQLLAEARKPKDPGPETRISLQGIVGNAAIINGDMYYAGQTVRGVKILKIGTDYLIGEYRGRKFRKVLK